MLMMLNKVLTLIHIERDVTSELINSLWHNFLESWTCGTPPGQQENLMALIIWRRWCECSVHPLHSCLWPLYNMSMILLLVN